MEIKWKEIRFIILIFWYINRIFFNKETTLSGKSIISNIKLAKEKGFYVTMNYIGVESVAIAKERVAIRVRKGSHRIPDEAIE